jgi:hypothetical protein
MRDGVMYTNKIYHKTRKTIYIMFVVSIVASLVFGFCIYLDSHKFIVAVIMGTVLFLLMGVTPLISFKQLLGATPQWIKKEGTILILHCDSRLMFMGTTKEIPVDVMTIERIDFIEPQSFGDPIVVIYRKGSKDMRISVDNEIISMLKELYFSTHRREVSA